MPDGISEEKLKDAVGKVTPADTQKALKSKKKISKRASKGLLKNMVEDVKILICLLHDWAKGEYPYAPWWTVSAITTALLWIANPYDALPDVLPLIGLLDDLTVLTMVLAMCEQDIKDYCMWKKEPPEEQE